MATVAALTAAIRASAEDAAAAAVRSFSGAVNVCDSDGETPLHVAVSRRNAPAIFALRDVGADVTVTSAAGGSVLCAAAAMDDDVALKAVLMAFPAVNVNACGGDGLAALHHAALHGCDASVRLLVGRGARVDVRDTHGFTPLKLARDAGRMAIANLLSRVVRDCAASLSRALI
jgi:ankyrin repeat protein